MTRHYSDKDVHEAIEFCAKHMLIVKFSPDESDLRSVEVIVPPPSSFAEPLVVRRAQWQHATDDLVEAVRQVKKQLEQK